MSTPISQPVTPSQPNLIAYGIQALALFTTFTRDTYQAAFGIQAPAWDPTRLRKTWFDSTVDTSNPANVTVYKILGRDQNFNWAITEMVMLSSEAASANLPGALTYPAYVITPSEVTRAGTGINPLYLSLESDAQALMAVVGGTGLLDEGSGGGVFPTVYPANEPRRLWDIVFEGHPVNVGALLALEYANGIGAPGSWDSSSGEPVWIPAPAAPTGLDDVRAPRDMPVRDLLPNEKIQAGLMGVSILRTDLQQQANEQAGQFTPDDRATLQQIYQIVSKLG
jgi:hypothetical protein